MSLSNRAPPNIIKSIISYFKDFSTFPKLKTNIELKEYDLDIFFEYFYSNLYKNFIYFNSKYDKTNLNSAKKKYFLSELANTLDIVYERKPDYFVANDFLKSMMAYLVYSLIDTVEINVELVIKIFLNLEDFLPIKDNKRIEDEILKFENNIAPTFLKLITKFFSDTENFLKIPKNDMNDLSKMLDYLKMGKYTLPMYLKGFINFNKFTNPKKFVVIKLYNYFKNFRPSIDGIDSDLYQGYALYGILSTNIPDIHFQAFKDIKKNRINNANAKKILDISIRLLEKENHSHFIDELNKINFDLEYETPTILDIFDDTNEYYKELFKQLRFYLTQYKKESQNKFCAFTSILFKRIEWLIFCKFLMLHLQEDNIKENHIKIIFYSIITLFDPNIDNDSLEFRGDVIPIYFSQSSACFELLNNQEIYKYIDDYRRYYPNFSYNNDFTKTFIDLLNKDIAKNKNIQKLKKKMNHMHEIYTIENYNKILPFPLLYDYLKKLNADNSANTIFGTSIYNLYKNCWEFLANLEKSEKENFIDNLTKITTPKINIHASEINDVIENDKFTNLIFGIMNSQVMKDAYERIYYFYSTNGEYDIYKEKLDKIENVINFNKDSNLINNQTIMFYYRQLLNSFKKINTPNLFIIMGLPETIKGFTFRFLKIIINSEGASFQSEIMDDENRFILIKAYLVFLIIHEQNHFMKRYFNKNKAITSCKTPDVKGYNEGGRHLIKLLFGDALIGNNLNIEQAKYILDINNWKKDTVYEFRRDFKAIKEGGNNQSIVYLNSPFQSMCDHSKLSA